MAPTLLGLFCLKYDPVMRDIAPLKIGELAPADSRQETEPHKGSKGLAPMLASMPNHGDLRIT